MADTLTNPMHVEVISGKTAKMAEKHFLSEVFNRMTVAEKSV